jgi:hypothetical protein
MGADVTKIEAPGGDLGRLIGPPWLGGDSVVALSFNRIAQGAVTDNPARERASAGDGS